ncbi:hypothetical protein PORY_000706 [Pneumocystis oryctolagi]|uniref:Uncharacterized protein n=1 Tax=Pneumocystis oryctolagi TaxID=42067 RepID=A0ACB7CDR5_9ASCO|nr:hypothetical protein PORY_000706 [Pneumocystis oryctolagi]
MKNILQKVFLILSFILCVFSTQNIVNDFLKRAKSNNGIIQLNSESINSVITQQRNYTMVIMFTATQQQYDCKLCKKLDPIFRLVAKSQRKIYPKSKELFFGILEFSDGVRVFEKLQLTTVPIIMVYPATVGPSAFKRSNPYVLNIKDGDISPEWIAQVISRETNQPIHIVRLTRSFIFFIITKKELWLVLSLISILVFNSGYMYTQIRSTPFSGHNNNNPVYILESFSSQYKVESHIVSMTYLVLTFIEILLAIFVPGITNKKKQTILIILLIFLQFIVFGFLIHIFQIKNRGYPFKLLVRKIDIF